MYFQDLYAKFKDDYIHTELDLKLAKIADDDYYLSSNAKIKHIIYQNEHYYNLNFSNKININQYFIDNISLNLEHLGKKILLSVNLSQDKKISFNIAGSNVTEKEIFLLWQDKFAYNTRKWLKKSLSKAQLENFSLKLDFDLTKKKKLTNLLGEFYATKVMKFHDKYGVIKMLQH